MFMYIFGFYLKGNSRNDLESDCFYLYFKKALGTKLLRTVIEQLCYQSAFSMQMTMMLKWKSRMRK